MIRDICLHRNIILDSDHEKQTEAFIAGRSLDLVRKKEANDDIASHEHEKTATKGDKETVNRKETET